MTFDTNVPVWAFAGVIAAGGWLYEQTSESGEDVIENRVGLEVLDTKVSRLQRDLKDTQDAVNRIEGYMLEGRK